MAQSCLIACMASSTTFDVLLCFSCNHLLPCRRDVDPALRRVLLDEALETEEQDNTELLTKYRQRLDR